MYLIFLKEAHLRIALIRLPDRIIPFFLPFTAEPNKLP